MLIRPVRTQDLDALARLYASCFAEPPWEERHDPARVRGTFDEILSWPEAGFVVAEDAAIGVVGAGIGFHVRRKPEVRRQLDARYRDSFYVAELFVDPGSRQRGACRSLADALVASAVSSGFAALSVRTSARQPVIRHLFVDRLGCEVVAESDGNIVMAGGLSSLDLPPSSC